MLLHEVQTGNTALALQRLAPNHIIVIGAHCTTHSAYWPCIGCLLRQQLSHHDKAILQPPAQSQAAPCMLTARAEDRRPPTVLLSLQNQNSTADGLLTGGTPPLALLAFQPPLVPFPGHPSPCTPHPGRGSRTERSLNELIRRPGWPPRAASYARLRLPLCA